MKQAAQNATALIRSGTLCSGRSSTCHKQQQQQSSPCAQAEASCCACWQVYTNQGVVARGRAAILQRLQSSAELHRAYGHGAHEVDAIDPQPLEVQKPPRISPLCPIVNWSRHAC